MIFTEQNATSGMEKSTRKPCFRGKNRLINRFKHPVKTGNSDFCYSEPVQKPGKKPGQKGVIGPLTGLKTR